MKIKGSDTKVWVMKMKPELVKMLWDACGEIQSNLTLAKKIIYCLK